jgi:CRP-like cAMP-binding protein
MVRKKRKKREKA